ncbi:MAG: CPBP family intramembrane glutamic endopeptidase [Ardenticatenales bacterium]
MIVASLRRRLDARPGVTSAALRTTRVWIGVALLFPLSFTWLYFVALADAPAPWPQLVYGLGKAIQFAPALLWLAVVRPDLLRPRTAGSGDLAIGVAFGALAAAGMAVLYTGWPFDLLGADGLAAFRASMAHKAAALHIATPVRFAILGAFYALVHSGLEEAYWRGLVFTALRARTTAAVTIAVTSVAFALHHVVLLTTLMPGRLPLALFLSLCVGVGGAAWGVQRSRSGSLLGAWLGHAVVDAAIFGVGWLVLFGGGGG